MTTLVVVVALGILELLPIQYGFAAELIRNGSFEADGLTGGPFLTEWSDGPSAGNDIGFATAEYPFFESGSGPAAFELPPGVESTEFTGLVAPLDAGRFYGNQWGRGNGTGRRGSATQILDISRHAGKPFTFNTWLASRVLDTDYASVSLDFYDGPDATGALLGQVAFDGDDQASPFIVGSLNLEGYADPLIPATQDNWTLYRTTGIVPATAASATVVIRGAGVTGGGNDGYVDLVSLQVIPEPASALLGCFASVVGAVWCVRQRISGGRA